MLERIKGKQFVYGNIANDLTYQNFVSWTALCYVIYQTKKIFAEIVILYSIYIDYLFI